MKTKRPIVIIILLTGILATAATPVAEAGALSEMVFYVHWYDVGKAALEGLAGIHNVTRGWHSGREINTVSFDPAVITPEDMVAALKAAGTYAGTVE
jgi:hypothetical protein